MTMPNFLIIGAAKAGTTSLYHYLKQHPQIYMSPKKEPQFFAIEGERINFQSPNRSQCLSFVTDLETYLSLFRNVTNEIAIGEASTWYLYIEKAAQNIKNYLPDVKIIIMLRDPVERAYSSFCGKRRDGVEPLSDFAEALSVEKERIIANWSPGFHYKQRGFYFAQVKRYLELFESNQIRIFLYDDFKIKPLAILDEIFNFLGFDATFIPDLSQKYNISGVPKNSYLHNFLKSKNQLNNYLEKCLIPAKWSQKINNKLININLKEKPTVSTKIRQKMIEEYREDIFKLEQLIKRDLSPWLKV